MAISECQPVTKPQDIPCVLTSTWNYTPPCSSHNATIFNETGINIINYTFSDFGSSSRCNITWNISTTGSYTGSVNNGDTFNIIVEAEDNMTSLGVILFLMILNLSAFAGGLIYKTASPIKTEIVKKFFWILGLLLLTFNTTILATLSENAGLGITSELFVFQWLFIRGLYIAMIFIFWTVIVNVPKLMAEKKKQERMGEDG